MAVAAGLRAGMSVYMPIGLLELSRYSTEEGSWDEINAYTIVGVLNFFIWPRGIVVAPRKEALTVELPFCVTAHVA